MKKIYLFIVCAFLIQASVKPQPCLPEGITFTTQAQIDNFQSNYPGCTEIEGNITIYGNAITNLNGLNVLNSIGGNLIIGNPMGGNDNLTNLSGLENVQYIGGELDLFYNNALTSLAGLEGLTTIAGNLRICGNHTLTDIMPLENISEFSGILEISNNALLSLSGLEGITSVELLFIAHNNSLTDLSGLEGLVSIDSDLTIRNNTHLDSLSGLENLLSIGGYIKIHNNNSLKNLNGLDNLDASNVNFLQIDDNWSLSNCDAQSICNYLASPNGQIGIYNNDTGCNSPVEIADHCGVTLPCLPYGNYYFFTQTEIDSFPSNYPNCTTLEGTVRIRDGDIYNLEGLNSVTSISGSLLINSNDSLASLTDLESLVSVGNNLSITYNPKLNDLTGLEGIASIGGQLSITYNPDMINLAGLENLTSIGEDLYIYANDTLTSLSGIENIDANTISGIHIFSNNHLSACEVQSICDYLVTPNGTIEIYYNAPGCNSPEEVEEACLETSIKEIPNELEISISPNPVNKNATVTLASMFVGSINICLYNSTGVCLKSWQFHYNQSRQKEFQINLKKVPAGMYFLQVKVGDEMVTKKIIKL